MLSWHLLVSRWCASFSRTREQCGHVFYLSSILRWCLENRPLPGDARRRGTRWGWGGVGWEIGYMFTGFSKLNILRGFGASESLGKLPMNTFLGTSIISSRKAIGSCEAHGYVFADRVIDTRPYVSAKRCRYFFFINHPFVEQWRQSSSGR